MWNGVDKCGEEGSSSKKMKLLDDQEKQVDKLKEEEGVLTDKSSDELAKKVKVFGILGNRYFDKDNNDESYKEEADTESIPWNWDKDYMPRSMTGFWKCRLVGREFNQAIEQLHQNEDAGQLFILEEPLAKFGNWKTERFSGEAEVDKFMSHFKETHGTPPKMKKCPFLGRSVEIVFDTPFQVKSFQAYFDKVMNLLEQYGEEVWYFQFTCTSDGGEDVSGYIFWYLKLKQMVAKMPHLKALRIKLDFVSEEDAKALEKEIDTNPFPKMENLQLISASQVPSSLTNHLINNNRQISVLDVLSLNLGGKIGKSEIFTDNLPNLRRLRFEVNSMEDLELFENYPHPLKLVEFGLVFGSGSMPFVRWSRVFKIIEAKVTPELCKFLYLTLPEPTTNKQRNQVIRDTVNCRLQLNKVEYFWFLNPNARFCLDFLLPSGESLEWIQLSCDKRYVWDGFEILEQKVEVTFLGFEDEMENSNINGDFTRLKHIKVSDECETRVYKVVGYDIICVDPPGIPDDDEYFSASD